MKEYIGDGVYAAVSIHGDVVLTTENGVYTSNTVVMEPVVLTNLEDFVKRAREAKVIR
jgi:hypothetical protein